MIITEGCDPIIDSSSLGCRMTTVLLSLFQIFDYNGGRTLDDLIKYVEGQLEGKVVEEEEEEEPEEVQEEFEEPEEPPRDEL